VRFILRVLLSAVKPPNDKTHLPLLSAAK